MAAEAQQASRPISKKHLFVRDGLFKAELDEFFKRELAEDGYSGVIVRKSKTCEVIIIATRPSQVLGGLAVRRAAYGVLRFVMEQGARGCEVVISGKIRGQRAKAMKFVDGMMIHSGYPVREYVDTAVRHVLLRQGVLGVKVKILKPHDESGMNGPKMQYPDIVQILEPKEETSPAEQKVKDVQ